MANALLDRPEPAALIYDRTKRVHLFLRERGTWFRPSSDRRMLTTALHDRPEPHAPLPSLAELAGLERRLSFLRPRFNRPRPLRERKGQRRLVRVLLGRQRGSPHGYRNLCQTEAEVDRQICGSGLRRVPNESKEYLYRRDPPGELLLSLLLRWGVLSLECRHQVHERLDTLIDRPIRN